MAHRIWKNRKGQEVRHILAESRDDNTQRTLCGSAIPKEHKKRGKAADGDCTFCKEIEKIYAQKVKQEKKQEQTASASA